MFTLVGWCTQSELSLTSLVSPEPQPPPPPLPNERIIRITSRNGQVNVTYGEKKKADEQSFLSQSLKKGKLVDLEPQSLQLNKMYD